MWSIVDKIIIQMISLVSCCAHYTLFGLQMSLQKGWILISEYDFQIHNKKRTPLC